MRCEQIGYKCKRVAKNVLTPELAADKCVHFQKRRIENGSGSQLSFQILEKLI